jgi:hypothetical protein
MRRRHHSFKERVLAILERVAELWAGLFLHLVALPALNRALRTKEDVDAAERHLFRTDAHITRAIYKTARRLAGLPRIPCPIENFYRPKLKSARHIRWLFLNCTHKLQYSRRLAIRMARRWKQADERKQRDPLCDLRGDIIEFPHHNFPPSADGRGGGSRRSRETEGAAPRGFWAHAPRLGASQLWNQPRLADPSARSHPCALHAPS